MFEVPGEMVLAPVAVSVEHAEAVGAHRTERLQTEVEVLDSPAVEDAARGKEPSALLEERPVLRQITLDEGEVYRLHHVLEVAEVRVDGGHADHAVGERPLEVNTRG